MWAQAGPCGGTITRIAEKGTGWLTHNTVVARPAGRAEVGANNDAAASMRKESDKLRGQKGFGI